jgi:predicted MPP superfamily phosphohydrolase
MHRSELYVVTGFLAFWLCICAAEVWCFLRKIFFKTVPSPGIGWKIVHVLAAVGALSFLYSYFIEPHWIQVRQIDLMTDKIHDTNIKIVQISDLHCDAGKRNESKVVQLVNALNPDVIVFTGDAVNDESALLRFRETLKRMNATIGKFAVRGNFDVWRGGRADLFEGTGFKELNRQSEKLRKGADEFYLSGVEAHTRRESLSFLRQTDPSKFGIFLAHYPDFAEDLQGFPVDLYLAGHTHGGQVALPFYGAMMTLARHGKKYEAGRYEVNGMTLYVNRGLGMEGGPVPRVRFWSRPEITVLNIHPRHRKPQEAGEAGFLHEKVGV